MSSLLGMAIIWLSMMGCDSSLEKLTVNDVTGLNPVTVSQILQPQAESEIIAAIQSAQNQNKKISIAGATHSQGKQTAYSQSVVLDLSSFNEILEIDQIDRLIRVQPGATWEKIQDAISPLGLSVAVQQASNIFTVGGSLSVNIHGWDPRFGVFSNTVQSFSMINHEGEKIEVSRQSHPELFRLVVGGYGLFGVVTEVTLKLTENHLLKKTTREMSISEYVDFYQREIVENTNIELHYARPQIVPTSLFDTLLVSTYRRNEDSEDRLQEKSLPDEELRGSSYFFFWLSRYFRIPGVVDPGKRLRWYLQRQIVDNPDETIETSRNRAMRPEIQFALLPSGFFHTDVLQEYFVGTNQLEDFMKGLKGIVKEHGVNLLSVTVRPIAADHETKLPYAKKDGFAVVLYINRATNAYGERKIQRWTKELIDFTLSLEGTFYLPYANLASEEQLLQAYPELTSFIEAKKRYDPDEIFYSGFYSYLKPDE